LGPLFCWCARQIAAGHYVKYEDMKAWLLSWGQPNELPPPKCACGEDRPEDFLADEKE
jgi:hypothetical protein